jgi:BCD family chlorophyll transporter-like MFS transporter
MSLRIDDVHVSIGEHHLLNGIDLQIAAGRIVCVVGPNGAGKTTLLDAICDLVPSTGSIQIVGADGVSSVDRNPETIGRAFQGSPLPATLTVAEVAVVVASSRAGAEELMGRFGLLPHASSFVSELSTGMKRILDLAVATAHRPSLLILDEPSSGLAAAEIEHLAALIKRWRDTSNAAILVVEHDAALVQAIADEVVVLDDGRVSAHGDAREMLEARRSGTVRLRRPEDPEFRDALHVVANDAAPVAPLPRRALSTWTLLRLGLRQFAAGMSAALIFGVLNRVLKVELGLSLAVVAPILASLNLAAPLALGVGHRSDTRPIFGYRRSPYIIGGALITGLAVAGAPHAAGALADGLTATSVLAALALFIVMGIGMYGAGTVFFALIADLAPEEERGHAASLVYLMLLGGVFAGVALTAAVLHADASNLSTLFTIAGVLVFALTTIGVWGHEPKVTAEMQLKASEEHTPFRIALREVTSMSQARSFFLFMILSTIFLFLQQAVLEPYGGEVLGMDVRTTTAFNAMLTLGILLGMVSAGRPWAAQVGHLRMAKVGLIWSGIGFALLGFAALASSIPPSWLTIFGIGIGNGIFSVAGLALMMSMASRGHAALFMGAWTVAHALAEGVATGGGGVIYEVLASVTGGPAGGYASVFFIQGVGLLACIPLLRRIDLDRFRAEVDALASARTR